MLPGAKRLVYTQKPRPSALLTATQRRAMQKLLDAVNPARTQAATLMDFFVWLDNEAPSSEESPTLPVSATPDETLLHEWYQQDATRSSTMMIPLPRTFERYTAWAAANGSSADSGSSPAEKIMRHGSPAFVTAWNAFYRHAASDGMWIFRPLTSTWCDHQRAC